MGGSSAPMPYTPANQSGADSAYYSTLNNLTSGNQSTYNTAATGFNDTYNAAKTNPFNASAMSGTVSAADAAMKAGGTDIANAKTLGSYAVPLEQYGFDPQGMQFNYGLTQAQDSQKVANAEAGVAGSPFGAGAVGDAGTNFTMGWQAQQATKAQQAIAALSSLFGQQSNLANTGAQSQEAAAVLPRVEYNAQNDATMKALQALVTGTGAASAPLSSDVGQFGSYLQLGQSSTQIADQATQYNNSQSGLLGALGSIFGGSDLGSLFGGGGGGSSGGGGGGSGAGWSQLMMAMA